MKEYYNGVEMDIITIANLKRKERRGFRAGALGCVGMTKGEYNRMMADIHRSIPNMHPLMEVMFPLATPDD